MAQGGIRKGFFFYFGLFVLLLIAIFLVILVILFFNPGKTICWLQYFNKGETVQLQMTTDDSETPINLTDGSIDRIVVDCSYANVYVQVNEEIGKSCVQIVNEASGFATYVQARPFEYSVVYDEQDPSTLRISVTEPVGFIYLSKNISITINIRASYSQGNGVVTDGDFSNVDFEITTTDGNIFLGTSQALSHEIRPGNITAKTDSGNIYLSRNLELDNTKSLSLTTGSGDITTDNYNISLDDSGNLDTGDNANLNAKGIVMTMGSSLTLSTNTGQMDFDLVSILGMGNLRMENENGNITIDQINVSAIELDAYEGNYYFGTVTADEVSFTPSEDRIMSPNIRIGTLRGNIFISSSRTNASPDVTVDHLFGRLSVTNTNGIYNIGEISGVIVFDSNSGTLNATLADNRILSQADTIETESGNITLTYAGVFNNTMNITTNSGRVRINISDSTGFTSTVKDTNGENLPSDSNRISVNIGTNEAVKNPLTVPGDGTRSGTIIITTGGNVEYVKID